MKLKSTGLYSAAPGQNFLWPMWVSQLFRFEVVFNYYTMFTFNVMCGWIALPSFIFSKQEYSQIYATMYILASGKEIKAFFFKLKFQSFLCQFYF